jgi:hypothetical protein
MPSPDEVERVVQMLADGLLFALAVTVLILLAFSFFR